MSVSFHILPSAEFITDLFGLYLWSVCLKSCSSSRFSFHLETHLQQWEDGQ